MVTKSSLVFLRGKMMSATLFLLRENEERSFIFTASNFFKTERMLHMKKILCLLLTFVLSLSLCACGNSSSKIGDTTVDSNKNFEVKLLSTEFIEQVNVDPDDPDFFTSNFSITGNTLFPGEGHIFFLYTYEYKFVGKMEVTDTFRDYAQPTLIYDKEYTFSENYCSVRKENKEGSKWYYLTSDVYGQLSGSKPGMKKIVFCNNTYRPLDDTTYQVRGIISVPEKVKNEPKSLEFSLAQMGEKYVIE